MPTSFRKSRRAIGRAIRQALLEQLGVPAAYVHLVGPKWLLKTSSGKLARAMNRELMSELNRNPGRDAARPARGTSSAAQ